MPLEGLPADLAGNEALSSFENVEALARGYVDVQARSDPSKWRDSLPDDLKGNPGISKYQSLEELARGHVNANDLIGRKRAMPGDDATPTEWEQYYTDRGRPESADKYTFARPEDFPQEIWSPELEKSYRELAFKYGLNQKEMEGLGKEFVGAQANLIKQIVANETAQREQVVKELKGKWGDKYDERIKDADLLLKNIADRNPKVAEALVKKDPVFSHPALVELMVELGQAFKDSDFVTGGVHLSPALQEERARLMGTEAYQTTTHPDHLAVVAKVKMLYAQIHPASKDRPE